jgi:ribosome-binding protein aMBF1 (putative translation factor)
VSFPAQPDIGFTVIKRRPCPAEFSQRSSQGNQGRARSTLIHADLLSVTPPEYARPVTILGDMLRRDRKREGLSLARAAWLLGVSVRELREIEAGERYPSFDTYERIAKLFGWPQSFVGERRE